MYFLLISKEVSMKTQKLNQRELLTIHAGDVGTCVITYPDVPQKVTPNTTLNSCNLGFQSDYKINKQVKGQFIEAYGISIYLTPEDPIP